MPISLYDVSVSSYLQTLDATIRFVEKGRKHFEEHGTALDEVVATRLYEDMAPFLFQILSVAHHSHGALKALAQGEFAPPKVQAMDYDGLQKHLVEARDGVASYSGDQIEALADGEVIFKIGDRELRFTSADFILSFSLPNFYFHATTAYDILRMKGVPVGKRDFMGRLRFQP